jgi:hypothetical protein
MSCHVFPPFLPLLINVGLHQEVTRLYSLQGIVCLIDRESNDEDVKLRCLNSPDFFEVNVSHVQVSYLFLFNDLLLVTKEIEQDTSLFRGVMNKVCYLMNLLIIDNI